jgi:hypothetical protein
MTGKEVFDEIKRNCPKLKIGYPQLREWGIMTPLDVDGIGIGNTTYLSKNVPSNLWDDHIRLVYDKGNLYQRPDFSPQITKYLVWCCLNGLRPYRNKPTEVEDDSYITLDDYSKKRFKLHMKDENELLRQTKIEDIECQKRGCWKPKNTEYGTICETAFNGKCITRR